MKVTLLLCLLAVSQMSAEYIFLPGNPETHSMKLEIPGLLFDKKDALTLEPAEGDLDTVSIQDPVADTQARAKVDFKTAAAVAAGASTLKAAIPLTTFGTGAASPIITFQADTAINAAAPLCLACTCRLGRTSCRDAGGVAYWSNGEPAIGQGSNAKCDGNGCIIEAPSTMSACDPLCKKRTSTCDPQVSPANTLKCTENVDKSFCNTDCQFRAFGEKVVCNQQAIVRGVMNDIPRDICSVFTGRKRRDAGSESRQGRFLSNSLLARLVPAPASTIRIPGAAVLSYAPTGRCIQKEIANAPLCTKLD